MLSAAHASSPANMDRNWFVRHQQRGFQAADSKMVNNVNAADGLEYDSRQGGCEGWRKANWLAEPPAK
jgi:hypothetical protein